MTDGTPLDLDWNIDNKPHSAGQRLSAALVMQSHDSATGSADAFEREARSFPTAKD